MEHDTDREELQNLVLIRVPPGDRWTMPGLTSAPVYNSLTEGLNAVFGTSGATRFFVDARKGTVHSSEEIEIPKKKYSIYGDQ